MIRPPKMVWPDLVLMAGDYSRPWRHATPLELEAGRERPGHTEAASMCNLYSITTYQLAISRLFLVMNRYIATP
jgi:hypothetical protein